MDAWMHTWLAICTCHEALSAMDGTIPEASSFGFERFSVHAFIGIVWRIDLLPSLVDLLGLHVCIQKVYLQSKWRLQTLCCNASVQLLRATCLPLRCIDTKDECRHPKVPVIGHGVIHVGVLVSCHKVHWMLNPMALHQQRISGLFASPVQ
jgi:hypothetical protein